MGELDLGAGGKAPFESGGKGLAAVAGVKLVALVPETAWIADLYGGAAEEDGGEVRLPAVPPRFQQ
jgi:hypothetical protein